jgi:hypothetical protein
MADLTGNADELRTHSNHLAELSNDLDQTVFTATGAVIGDGAYGQLLAGFASDIRKISQPGLDVLVQAAKIMNDTSDDMHKSAVALAGVEDRGVARFKQKP